MTTRTELVLEALGIEIHRRGGNRVWALCPYHHSEHATPFFVRISGERAGQNHCFSCKKGGSLTELVAHVRKIDLRAARLYIEATGKSYEPPKVRVRIVAGPPKIVRTRFAMPREVIFEPLSEWVTPARSYMESRKITAEEVELYGLGYAVDGRLGGRIVIPWLGRGRIPGGYSARTFCDQEPKYITPPEADAPDQGTMFGEHLWPETGRRDVIVITEGALNAMAVRRVWEVAVGALGGSELDPIQVTKIATFGRVIILTDPDAAGDKAATRLANMLGRWVQTTRIRLPEGSDALDIGPELLRAHLLPAMSA